MDIDNLYPNFTFVDMVRLDSTGNAERWYRVSWEPTLLGPAVVRMYGRVGHKKRRLQPLPFDLLEEAWPQIRATIQRQLDSGYDLRLYAMELPAPPMVTMSFGPASADVLAALGEYEQLTIVDNADRQQAAIDGAVVDKIKR